MNKRIFIVGAIVVCSVCFLIFSAIQSSSKQVVTVAELLNSNEEKKSVRLGAQVASSQIVYEKRPKLKLSFFVKDILATKAVSTGSKELADEKSLSIEVVYYGSKPDTLAVGRDVILEGDYRGGIFYASNLLTQCPSKYEPPDPSSGDY